ncbi:MAG: hypothetical protein HFF18_04685 [Oscillospiraceae bacterium]|nr:hypothetical protein [Oscillospiraceae bacterium]
MSINILPFRVYQVLSEHTDGDHALTMRDLLRPLEPSEVRLLSDAVSAFPGISQRQCERLLEKLRRGLSRWQREQCRPLPVEAPRRSANHETFLSVEVLEEAVFRRCQVRFQYMEYGMDKQLHPRQERPY